MKIKPEQLAGGALLGDESSMEVRAECPLSIPNAEKLAMTGSQGRHLGAPKAPGCCESNDSGASFTTKCVTLAAQKDKRVCLRVVGVKLDVEAWVKNVLVPALVDEFIEQNGKPR